MSLPGLWSISAICVALLAGQRPAVGQNASTKSSTVSAGDVSLQRSRVYIHVGKTGFGHEHAVEGRLSSGQMHLSGTPQPGMLVFHMPSFEADTPAARRYIGLSGETDAGTRSKVNANLRGSDVLDVQRHPTAAFKITSVTPLAQQSKRGLPQFQFDGQFTLHGQTRPLRFVADVDTQGDWRHIRGGFAINQTDFGMTPYTTALGAIGVADRLTIFGDLWVAERDLKAAQAGAESRR